MIILVYNKETNSAVTEEVDRVIISDNCVSALRGQLIPINNISLEKYHIEITD